MQNPGQNAFIQLWPKYFVTFTAILECLVVILLFLTELGNVAANFWRTNVFAGGWTGIILFIHTILLFIAGCCSPGRPAAFRAVILSLVGLIATAAAISFNVAFLIVPNACILTPSCEKNAGSTSAFNYGFQQSFFTSFRGSDLFKSYTENQIKYLFQSIQIGVAAVGFLNCLIFVIVFYLIDKKAKQQIRPTGNAAPSFYSPPPPLMAAGSLAPIAPNPPATLYPPLVPPAYPDNYQPVGPPLPPPSMFYHAPPAMWRPPPRIPQAPPGQIPWNNGHRY